MTTVYLCRHGQYIGQDKVVAFRAKNHPLSDLGKKQVKKVAAYFEDKKISVIYSSPLQRCLESAKIVGEKNKLKVTTDDRLLEVKSPFDDIELDKYLEITGKVQRLYDLPLQISHGETIEEVESRMAGFLNDTLEKFKDKNIVVYSHGDPIMILIYHLLNKDFSKFGRFQDPYIEVGEFFKLDFNGKKLINQQLIGL